jgi:hypothetical protein
MEEITKLVNRLFESREQSHVYHLQSTEYSKHVALEGYYSGILPLIDIFVEVYQGQFELLGDYYNIEVNDTDKSDMVKYFDDLVDYLKESTSEFESHLKAIIDDMVILLYQTIYKLKYLK